MQRYVLAGSAIVALALLGFFLFPGHTYLQSDTQIYIPMFEHLWNPAMLASDIIAVRPHLSFTIYDEVSLGMRRLTGLDFEYVLQLQQVAWRILGLLGFFLIGRALKLSLPMSLLVTAIAGLGATIVGPTVLTFEYEPVPRGFAVPLLLLAVGLAAHQRHFWAGVAGSVAFLYHAPTTVPFWAIYFLVILWPSRPEVMRGRMAALPPLTAAVLLIFVLSRLQPGVTEPQVFLGRIDPELEALQRMRASYNWVSLWVGQWYGQYLFFTAAIAAAYFRLRPVMAPALKPFVLGLPLLGIVSIPLSYLLLEKMKWILIPQYQPARALLFVTLFAVILSSAAAIHAAQKGIWWESFLWFAAAYAVPLNTRVLDLLWPDFSNATLLRRFTVMIVLAAIGVLAAWADARKRKWASAVLLLLCCAPFWAMPGYARVVNFPALHTEPLQQLSQWARTETAKDSIFLFADAARDLAPGIFRARAIRPVYVCWKAGGQVNYHKNVGEVWWERWRQTMASKFAPSRVPEFAGLGIDYLVLKPEHRLPDRRPVFENEQFLVYHIR
ncbi:MAG: hypothetical protein IT170_00955 [Bryobacterales bacterium]|nr:hypothetical protein [Bryobacterales bacterium]